MCACGVGGWGWGWMGVIDGRFVVSPEGVFVSWVGVGDCMYVGVYVCDC